MVILCSNLKYYKASISLVIEFQKKNSWHQAIFMYLAPNTHKYTQSFLHLYPHK